MALFRCLLFWLHFGGDSGAVSSRVKVPAMGHVPVMGPFLLFCDPPTPGVSKLNRLVISVELTLWPTRTSSDTIAPTLPPLALDILESAAADSEKCLID